MGVLKNPGDQTAVLKVIPCQRRFILTETAVDFIHAVIRGIAVFALAEQCLRHGLQTERRELPGRGFQGIDTVNNQPPRSTGKKLSGFEAVLPPGKRGIITAENQRDLIFFRMALQNAQIKLDQAPADYHVRIMFRQPLVQTVKQIRAARDILQREIRIGQRCAVLRAEHKNSISTATGEPDGVKITELGGFDIQRNDFQRRAVIRMRFHQHMTIRLWLHPDSGGDKTLHQIALAGADIRFIKVQMLFAELFFQLL